MRCFLLPLFIFLVASLSVSAQEVKPDTIFQRGQAKITAKIVEVTDSLVRYRSFTETDGPVDSLHRNQIDKIVYGNGLVEEYAVPPEKPREQLIAEEKAPSGQPEQEPLLDGNAPGNPKKVMKPARNKRPAIAKANKKVGERLRSQVPKVEKEDSPKVIAKTDSVPASPVSQKIKGKKIKEKKTKYPPRTILSLVADKSNMLTGALEEKTTGKYDKGYGGLLRFQYNVTNQLGLRLSSGYMQWSRKDSISPAQSMVSTLRTMPVMFGFKHYYNRVVYLTFDAGVAAQKTSFKTFDNELQYKNWQMNTSGYTLQPCAALSLGAEVKITKLVLDVSPYFQWVYTEGTEYGTYYAGLRVGLGIAMGKRKD